MIRQCVTLNNFFAAGFVERNANDDTFTLLVTFSVVKNCVVFVAKSVAFSSLLFCKLLLGLDALVFFRASSRNVGKFISRNQVGKGELPFANFSLLYSIFCKLLC